MMPVNSPVRIAHRSRSSRSGCFFKCFWLLLLALPWAEPAANAGDAKLAAEWLRQAEMAVSQRDPEKALNLLEKVLGETPESAQAHYLRGRIHEDARRHAEAVASYSLALRFDPKASGLYQRRGCEFFRMGRFTDALDDFDRFIALAPQQEAEHWQRGIAYYYAGLYEKGRRQFELHRTVNPNDVENAVWHFLCVARLEGVEAARKAFIPIRWDRRIPMMELHGLYAGRKSTNDVLQAVRQGVEEGAERRGRQFYADLYIGLFLEATGEAAAAKPFIERAASVGLDFGYMGDVARVHLDVMRRQSRPAVSTSSSVPAR